MSKSKEPTSLAEQLHQCTMPVRLLVGTVPHPSEVPRGSARLLGSKLRNFGIDSVAGSGQFIQEEQPAQVLDAVTKLAQAAGQTPGRGPDATRPRASRCDYR